MCYKSYIFAKEFLIYLKINKMYITLLYFLR